MSRAIVLSIASFVFIVCTGCGIPVMVAVVPCVGSGDKVSFGDKDGKPIEADGLLLVCRTKDWGPVLPWVAASSTRAVIVRNGEARIPYEWVPASLWLTPNPYLGLIFLTLFTNPPLGLLQLPVALVPIPRFIPWESVFLVPLLPGYHPGGSMETGERMHYAECDNMCYLPTSRICGIPNPLTQNRTEWRLAESYWRMVLERVKQANEFGRGDRVDSWPVLRFGRRSEYQRVRVLIEEELEHIRTEIGQDGAAESATEGNANVQGGGHATNG